MLGPAGRLVRQVEQRQEGLAARLGEANLASVQLLDGHLDRVVAALSFVRGRSRRAARRVVAEASTWWPIPVSAGSSPPRGPARAARTPHRYPPGPSVQASRRDSRTAADARVQRRGRPEPQREPSRAGRTSRTGGRRSTETATIPRPCGTLRGAPPRRARSGRARRRPSRRTARAPGLPMPMLDDPRSPRPRRPEGRVCEPKPVARREEAGDRVARHRSGGAAEGAPTKLHRGVELEALVPDPVEARA